MIDYTRWFQREVAKIDRRIQGITRAKETKEELWRQRNKLFEPGYADGLYKAYAVKCGRPDLTEGR